MLNSQKRPSPFSYVFIAKWRSRLSEDEIAEFLTKTERKTYCSMYTIHLRSRCMRGCPRFENTSREW